MNLLTRICNPRQQIIHFSLYLFRGNRIFYRIARMGVIFITA
jgi:hypothetical protein